MWQVTLAAVIGSFVLSLVLTWLMRRFALRIGFVDVPGGHKEHARPIALGGGIAIFLTVALPALAGVIAAKLSLQSGYTQWLPSLVHAHLEGIASKVGPLAVIIAGAFVLHAMGLIDDVRALDPWTKLIVQTIVSAAIVIGAGVRAVEAMGELPSIIITVIWFVAIINAFNFLDNIDGLCAGVAAIAAGIFALSAMVAGQIFVPTLAWLLVGACLGFLVFNFPPASIFMGDAGSTVIGYLLAVLTVLTTYFNPEKQLNPAAVLTPLVVLAVPLYDVASVVVHRLNAGVSPFRGDRRHFSHRLVRRGMRTRAAVLTIYLATAATGFSAVALARVGWLVAGLLFAQCVCIVLIIAVLEHSPRPE